MELFSCIMFWLFITMTINSVVRIPLEKLTKYKNSDIHDQSAWFVISFIFFGVLMLPLYKYIKKYRRTYYVKNQVKSYEFYCLKHGVRPPTGNFENFHIESIRPDDKYNEEYLNNKRYLKLIRLQQKSKRKSLIGM